MSTTTTKPGVVGTLVVIAVLIAGGSYLFKNQSLRKETQDWVEFAVVFNPTLREDGVHVLGTIEGVQFVNDLVSRSPYVVSTWIPKGGRASINVQQTTPGMLGCSAKLNGVTVDTAARQDIGSVRCYVNRPLVKEPAVK